MTQLWTRPAGGLWIGLGMLGSGGEDNDGGEGSGIMGGVSSVTFGLLGGANLGIGEDIGVFTGLYGALAILPFLGFGFVGIPLGVHFNRRFGLGIIIPVTGEISALAGVAVAILSAIASFAYIRSTGSEWIT